MQDSSLLKAHTLDSLTFVGWDPSDFTTQDEDQADANEHFRQDVGFRIIGIAQSTSSSRLDH